MSSNDPYSTPDPGASTRQRLSKHVQAYLKTIGKAGGRAVPPERRHRFTPEEARAAAKRSVEMRKNPFSDPAKASEAGRKGARARWGREGREGKK